MKIIKILILLFLLTSIGVTAVAQNPFTSKSTKQPVSTPVYQSWLFEKIIDWQHQIKEKMSSLVREAKETRSIRPVLLLILAAFIYGAIHAAGPGHGKAIAMSYVFTQHPSYIRGLVFGNCMALFHGISGIVFVLVVRLILHVNIAKNLDNITLLTQRVSYGIITCFGASIFIYGLYHLFGQRSESHFVNESEKRRKEVHPVISALVVGGIPCPGVVMVMLFALSMDLIVLGIVLGIAISVGMALTVSIVVMLAVSGKTVAVSVIAKNEDRMIMMENIMKIIGGLALIVIGAVFLSTVI